MPSSIGARLALAGLALLIPLACSACTDRGIVLNSHDLDIPSCATKAPIHVQDLVDQVRQHCNPEGATLIYPDGFTTRIGGTGGTSETTVGSRVAYGSDNIARYGVIAFRVTDQGKKVQWWGPKHALQLYWSAFGKHPPLQ